MRKRFQHVLAMQHVEELSSHCDMFIAGSWGNLIRLCADGETEASFRVPDIDGFDK